MHFLKSDFLKSKEFRNYKSTINFLEKNIANLDFLVAHTNVDSKSISKQNLLLSIIKKNLKNIIIDILREWDSNFFDEIFHFIISKVLKYPDFLGKELDFGELTLLFISIFISAIDEINNEYEKLIISSDEGMRSTIAGSPIEKFDNNIPNILPETFELVGKFLLNDYIKIKWINELYWLDFYNKIPLNESKETSRIALKKFLILIEFMKNKSVRIANHR